MNLFKKNPLKKIFFCFMFYCSFSNLPNTETHGSSHLAPFSFGWFGSLTAFTDSLSRPQPVSQYDYWSAWVHFPLSFYLRLYYQESQQSHGTPPPM